MVVARRFVGQLFVKAGKQHFDLLIGTTWRGLEHSGAKQNCSHPVLSIDPSNFCDPYFPVDSNRLWGVISGGDDISASREMLQNDCF